MTKEGSGAVGRGDRRLVVGVLEDQLVFVAEEMARDLAEAHRAVAAASTWGELRRGMSTGLYVELLAHYGPDEQPQDGDPFDCEEVGPYLDGDWPPWPAQRMLDWVPQPIQEAHGHLERSAVSGPCLVFDPAQAVVLVAAFEAVGYTTRRDDELVRTATYGD